MEGKLTVYFEDPFWVGVFEREDETGYRVCRVVFGPEPTDAELLAYVQEEYASLDFGEPLENRVEVARKKNFKRVQREVRREMEEEGVGTKAQRAMQAALELKKQEREVMSRERREEEKALKFKLRQERKREKRRGH